MDDKPERTSYAGRWRVAVPLLILSLGALAYATVSLQLSEDVVYSAGLFIVVLCGYVWVSGIK